MIVSQPFSDRLLRGERMIWTGQPRLGLRLRAADAFVIPVSLLWGGFMIFWNVTVWESYGPFPFSLFGIPFLVIGLFLIAGRFWVDAFLRRRTNYALTDRRALIRRDGPFATTRSVDLARLADLELDERADGTGTIRFGPPTSPLGFNGMALWSPAFDPTPQFVGIDRVRQVYDLIQRRTA